MADPPLRRDVSRMPEWDPVLLWYARAVLEMQARPLDDPTSWRYQAAVHEYRRNSDPLAVASDRLPSQALQRRFWNACQHNCWYFLPWHRVYLSAFEGIVASIVVDLGGDPGWTLPYWSYDRAPDSGGIVLPEAFRVARLPDGSRNPLRVEQRRGGANSGSSIATPGHADVSGCLQEPRFSSPVGGGSSFGGEETGLNHDAGDAVGVDITPHGMMHVRVGGTAGWMSAFGTAALDPIFWLHHANIDRLWTVWLRRDPSHLNPTTQDWLTRFAFEFNLAGGATARFTSSQVVDTTRMPAPLASYRYEDESDPLGHALEAVKSARRRNMESERIPEMVGASEEAIVLNGVPTHARIPVRSPTGPVLEALEAGGEPAETFLHVENITSEGGPVTHAVYLNLPEGADPEEHPEHFAGFLPMFGVREASTPGDHHPGSGLTYVLRVGDVIRRLEALGQWEPGEVRLTFVPDDEEAVLESAAAVRPFRVGRVSLHVS
jgi:tyrosinase